VRTNVDEHGVEKLTALTAQEQAAIDKVRDVLANWPKGLSISIDDDDGVEIFKRYANGAAQRVAHIKKRNLTCP
jgi:hypothetical protein